MKLAAYLDEIDDDPVAACKVLLGTGITNVILRSAWGIPLVKLADAKYGVLKGILDDHNLSITAIAFEHPLKPVERIGTSKLEFAARLAMFYNCKLIAPFEDVAGVPDVFSDVKVLAEIINDTEVTSPATVAKFLANNDYLDNIRILYDPAMLMFRFNLDPFSKYWVLLKKYIAAVDIHDFKQGKGFMPVGLGDTKLKMVLNENPEWGFLEPGLGHRYANLTSKKESFLLALNALNILQRFDDVKSQ